MKWWHYILCWVPPVVLCLIGFKILNPYGQGPVKEIRTEKTFIYDSTKKSVPVPQAPASVSVYTVAVPGNINYDSIAKIFFAIYTYSQTIQDSCIRAEIFDSISHNKIIGRKFNYTWLKPVKTVESTTTTIIKNNNGFFIGGFSSASKTQFGIGPEVSYLGKNDILISSGYDLVNKSLRFGVNFKIHGKVK